MILVHMVLEYESDYSIRNTENTIPKIKKHCYINLPFWFSRNTGLALPLIALNNSDINIDIEFEDFMNVIKIDNYNNLDEISVKTDSEFDCKIMDRMYLFR